MSATFRVLSDSPIRLILEDTGQLPGGTNE